MCTTFKENDAHRRVHQIKTTRRAPRVVQQRVLVHGVDQRQVGHHEVEERAEGGHRAVALAGLVDLLDLEGDDKTTLVRG